MKNRNISRLAYVAACVVLPLVVSAVPWIQTESGTYSWNDPKNWENEVMPSASEKAQFNTAYPMPDGGWQIITGGGEALSLDLITAYPVSRSNVRTFTGDITAKTCVARSGTNEIAGTLTLTGESTSSSLYSRVGTSSLEGGIVCGVLDVVSGGSVLAEGKHAFYVGRNDDNNASASGRIRVRENGRFLLSSTSLSTASGLMLGRTSGTSTAPWFAASFVQSGGYAAIGRLIASYEKNANSTVAVCGGVLELPYVTSSSQFFIGYRGYSAFHQLGGEVHVNTNHVLSTLDLTPAPGYAFTVGSGLSAANGLTNAYFYACGGKFVNGSAFLIQGPGNNETGVMPVSATIDGNAVVTTRNVDVGANTNGDGVAILNLNGGELETMHLFGTSRPGVNEINANGGKITISDFANGIGNSVKNRCKAQFTGIDHINIYEGGLTVNCCRDVDFGSDSIVAPMRTAGGFGLKSMTRGSLAGCVYSPRIEIFGGSGSNATVTALVDYDRHQLTNIVVTCRGEGYRADDTLMVLLHRANANYNKILTNAVTVTLAENKPGALVKTGTGTLSLYAQPEFEGIYEVREGTMIQTTATTGSEKVSAIVVGGENAVFQCGSANSTATVAKSNPINPSATLTLGTANGPGTLAVPAAANGQSAAFEQTFASLTVNGTGNTIEMASGNTAANGAKVTFGDISCPDGATVTIPNWKSSLKVYVTGRPARTVFKNVLFAGTDLHAAVGPDGQLIPAPGFTLTLR